MNKVINIYTELKEVDGITETLLKLIANKNPIGMKDLNKKYLKYKRIKDNYLNSKITIQDIYLSNKEIKQELTNLIKIYEFCNN